MRAKQRIFSGQAKGTKNMTGGPKKGSQRELPQRDPDYSELADTPGASQGVPDFGKDHEAIVNRARINVCASDFIRSLREVQEHPGFTAEQVEVVKDLFEALALDPASQAYGHRKTVQPGESFCNTEGNGHSGDSRAYHAS